MPNSFANDGAVGAGTNSTGGFTQNDFGGPGNPQPQAPDKNQQLWDSTQSYLDHWNAGDQGSYSNGPGGPSYSTNDHGWANYNAHALGEGSMTPDAGVYTSTSTGNFNFTPPPGFAEGGAIPDDESGEGSPEQDQISKALESVDQVLSFGRKLHGLGGGDDEGAINTAAAMPMIPGNQSETPGPYKPGGGGQKTAAAMPMIPGNQSETPGPYRPGGGGQKTAAAMPMIPGNQSETPGPYKPGTPPPQRMADAGNDPDQDNDDDSGQSGAIDTDEDTA